MALAAVAWLASAGAAWGHEEFPGIMAGELNAPHDPPCSICHLGGKTSGATVATLFAWSMRARGLSGSPATVSPAIDEVQADGVDSDGDGVPDAQELIDGTNPNTPGAAVDIPDPQLGCHVVPGGRAGFAAWLVLVALAWLIRRRR
ncbi:MAG TPA: thrombospondin type 3 repeat-containing protein [Polyangia bacterium]|nr:thrombospondin type 3 repeat-containing protein [Polyangia bacterium]